MRRNILLYLILLLTLSCISISCQRERKFKIGISQCSQDDWREKMNSEIRREAMLHEDVQVDIRSADDNSQKQIEDIEYFVDNDFDIIIVSPNEAKSLTPVIQEVYAKGIPVVIFDRSINGDTYTTRIGVDDIGLGASAAKYAQHLVGKGAKALEVYGLPGSTPAEDRHTGFSSEFVAEGGEIVGNAAANWNQPEAEHVVDSMLRMHPETNLIFAHNDRMAIGASEVARRIGRDDIKIIGIDAAPNIGIKAVADSIIDATFLYPTEGERLVKTAIAILNGENVPKEIQIPLSSAVDRSNADILLMQNEALVNDSEKVGKLKHQVDTYLEKHNEQSWFLYAVIVILALTMGLSFMLLRAYWTRRRHQEVLLENNRLLEQQRDKERELNQKLQEATQSKLIFFTNVSHDLRTPLTLIAEPVSQLAHADNLTQSQQVLVKIADKNVHILQRLINQILDFRKYENGKLDLKIGTLDMAEAVRDWTESFNTVARKRNITLTLDIDSAQDYNCMVDPEKIERVYFNLVSNAFKYTPDNGSITVSLSVLNGELQLQVADTGEGINERDLGNIFDRFFQVDRVHPNGSGIGLSLAKAFVELHGGTITVESTLHKGSCFTVRIPLVIPSEVEGHTTANIINEETVEAELAPIESKVEFTEDKPLVLVIDDNKDLQKMLLQLLGKQYNVLGASNGKDGIRLALKYVPDVIICDVMMPGMDGMECVRQLKDNVVTSHIPVLMLTACTLDEQRVQGYESGADGYLSKPFNSNVLMSRLQSLIDNRRRIKDTWTSPASNVAKPEKESSRQLPASDIDNDFYNRFLEVLNKDIGNFDLSVDGIAAKLGLGRSQFYRKIKALTNYSPVELIRRLRLERAKTMLLTTDKTVSEIGYSLGFSTPAYFTKCYREMYGQTPSEVRTNS